MNKYVILAVTTLLIVSILFIFQFVTKKQESIKILFTGDMMLDRGTRKVIEKKNIDYLFQDIQSLFKQQDIVVVNLESSVCDTGLYPTPKAFNFRMDPNWLAPVRSYGITNVCLANNHSIDFGKTGLEQTYEYLIKNKIIPIGYQSKGNSCEPVLIEKNGVQVALLSSSFLYEKDLSGICHESGNELCERIKSFKAYHPKALIILCLHWGLEMKTIPEKSQIQQAHSFIDVGADLIIGHHPHVVQPIEKYNGKWIFYSLGNFIFDNNKDSSNKGIFACFTIEKNQVILDKTIPFFISNSKPFLMNEEETEDFLEQLNNSSTAFIE